MSTRGLYVLVKVLSVHRNYAFPCCSRCSTRIRTEHDENILMCSKCQQKYDKKQISYRYRINMTVSDRTQVSNVIVFGQCLEHFFGTSATHLKRFVEGLYMKKEELPLPVDQLVHQCIEQCFVGSMIRLCFRGLHPRQTDSQASRSSPTHLKNILRKMQEAKMNYLPRHRINSSHLLASHMSRPEDAEKSATVFELLKENLEFYRRPKSLTPSCGLTNGSYSMSYPGPLNYTLQINSRIPVNYTGLGRKNSEDFNLMVSPLVLSCEARGSSQSSGELDLSIQIDSRSKSQTGMQNTPIFDTALMLVSLLNTDTSEEYIDEPSSYSNNDTDIIHDKLRSTHTKKPAYFNSESIIEEPVIVRNAIENEKQKLQSSCSWPEKDHSVMNTQGDVDFFVDENLSRFFGNLSLESDWERNIGTCENSQYAKREMSFVEDQLCDRVEGSQEFQDHDLVSECNSLQESSGQISILFPEDMLSDLEFSNFSLLYDYDTLKEPRPSTSKTSPMKSSQDNMRTANEEFLCAMNSSNVERTNSHEKSSPNGNLREIPERMIMETSGENGSCRHSESVCCCSITGKPLCQDKDPIGLDFSSERVHIPAELSFQSLIEQTSTPVLFDDSSDSTKSRLNLCRSLSLPEALHPADVIETRGTNLNIHSTPLNSECQSKLEDLSDLQKYSGLFVDDRNNQIPIGPTVSLRAKAFNQDRIKCVDNCPRTRKSLENKECLHVFSSVRSRVEEALEREEGGEQNFVESFSFRNEMTPAEARQESWYTSDQICPESPLLFSFSSAESNSCKMTPDIQQDSLLCASLLECSYLK